MPTPADIHGIALARQTEARKPKLVAKALPPKPVENRVVWCGLSWQEIQDQGFMPQIEQHLVELTKKKGKDKAADYLKFLKNGPINHGGKND